MRLFSVALSGLVGAACGGGGASSHVDAPKLPAGTQRVAVDGSEVVIDIRGTGPVCIAHPGGPGFDSTYLHSSALEKRFTMIYIDPLGTGSSGKLPATELYSREHDVHAIEAVRAKLALDKVCLVGHSYGGFVVLEYAIAHPEHVGGLFLYSTTATTDKSWSDQVEANMAWFQAEPWFSTAMMAFAEEDRSGMDGAPPLTVDQANSIVQREVPMYFADWTGHKAQYEPVAATFRMFPEVSQRRPKGKVNAYDVRRRLGHLHTTPAVIVAGDKDFICGVGPSTALASEISNSELIIIKNAGHMSHVEQPAAFADAVETFAGKLR